MLARYRSTTFTSDGETKPLFLRGEGPAVIVMHEIPGITPKVVRFADWVADAGFQVYLPLLIGEAGRAPSLPYGLSSMARLCVRKEFSILAAHRSSPVTDWLRALARHASAQTGGGPVGAVGMCFSGNFALAMMMEPCLMAAVLSQPSMPLPLGRARAAALHVSPEELQNLKERCANGERVLGLRFRGDPLCPGAKFETLRREIGTAFEGIELDDASANPDAPNATPHSVLTEHLVDAAGEPTREAATRVLDFFRERLARPCVRAPGAPASRPR